MHTLATRLQDTVTDFVAQPEELWLLISAAAADAPVVFKLLLDCERQSRSDVFLLFGTPFVNQAQYADAVIAHYVAECRALAAARAATGPPGGVPEPLLAGTSPPAQRLAQVIRAAGELLPKDGDHRLVWALWPLAIADPVAYEQLLAALVPQRPEAALPAPEETPPRWPQSVRLIGRTGPEGRAGTSVVWGEQPIARVACDFSPAALQRSQQQSSADETRPTAVRIQARLMLATLAAAQGGVEAAVGHYSELLAYYQEQADPSMQTVVLLQLGEAYHRQQRLPEARACYERALTPAAAAPVPVCTAMLAKNLGDVAFLQQRYGDAVTCYRTWHRLAGRLGDTAGARTARKLLTLAQQHGGGPR